MGQPLHENDSSVSRIDLAKVGGQRFPSQLRYRAGHFNPGRAATDNNEIQKPSLFIDIGFRLGSFKKRPLEFDAASRSHRLRV